MKKSLVLLTAGFCFAATLLPAIFNGKKIDGIHFAATIKKVYQATWDGMPRDESDQEKEVKEEFQGIESRIDVVFVGKAANIRFHVNQVLPVDANDNLLMTLYLVEETIENPAKVVLKGVRPPAIVDDSKPEDWEADSYWHMKLDLSSLE